VDLALRRTRKLFVVCDNDERRSIAVQPLEEPDNLCTGFRIELTGWLVSENDCRAIRERTGYCDALLLTSR
jgi:hypothetical protein